VASLVIERNQQEGNRDGGNIQRNLEGGGWVKVIGAED